MTIRINAIMWLILFLGAGCRQEVVPEVVQHSIDEVRREYAPDRRVARFDIEAKATSEGLVLSGETSMADAKSALLQRLAEQNVSVIDEIVVLPSQELEDKIYGIVRLSACNIRSEPRHSAELSTQATLGTLLRVHKEQDGWFLVQTPDDYFGWLDAGGFQSMGAAEYEAWKAADKVVYLPDFGFSRAGPEVGAPPVSDLLAGNILRLAAVEGSYARVAYPDGREAFVPVVDVMNYERGIASREPAAENILATARTFLGRPYLWGGTSGKGVDCSGVTKTVFYLNGLMLPRDASQQVHTGVDIPTDTTFTGLQPGDLLFFGRKATEEQPEKIVHVAIYMGDGRMIHSAGTVKINSLRRGDPDFNAHRFDTFVRAKRLLSSIGEHGVRRLGETKYY